MISEKIAVIMPFYQHTSVLLVKALNSIYNQTILPEEIIIVDDSSPVSVDTELANVELIKGINLKSIKQKNGGAASARNTGLNNVSSSIKYIAFLDSDDEWTEDHLQNAIYAFQYGANFYFADFIRENWLSSQFKKLNIIFNTIGTKISIDKLYILDKKELKKILIKQHLIATPSVVYDFLIFKKLRFPEEFKILEDDACWLIASEQDAKFCISNNIEVICGEGINISKRDNFWASDRNLELLNYYLHYWIAIKNYISLNNEIRIHRQKKILSLRRSYVRVLLYRFFKMKRFSLSDLINAFKTDILFWKIF